MWQLFLLLNLHTEKKSFVVRRYSLNYLFCLCLIVCLSSCTHNEEEEYINPAKRTVLVYIVADNNLASFAKTDLSEMKAGMSQAGTEDLCLLAYVDAGSSAQLIRLKHVDGGVVEEVVCEYGDRNSAGVEEMCEVFHDVFSNPAFQAESYGLIYWSHADGWVPFDNPSTRWVGQDGRYRMNIDGLVQVLQTAPHFDFIMFDACFMFSVEVAYELRQFADYYVACPTENPGPGYPYDLLVPLMTDKEAAIRMADANYLYYEGLYTGGIGISNDNWTGGVSIGVFRSFGLENLASLTHQLLPDSKTDIDVLRKKVFDCDQRYTSHVGYYDLQELMQTLLDEADFETWKLAYDAIVYYKTTPMNYSQFQGMFSMERSNGATHYLPDTSAPTDIQAYHMLEWYDDAGLQKLGW